MKNVLRVVLAAVAVTLFAGAAYAANPIVAPTLRLDKLRFRTNAAANPAPGYLDSTYASSVGVAGASWPLDTTTAIATEGWFVPEQTALADSTDFFTVFIHDKDGSSVATGVDSMYICVQGSPDGITWVTTRTFVGGTISSPTDRLDQTNVTGAFRGMLSVNGASLANGAPVWMQRYRKKDTPVAQEPSDASLASWPYLRFIIGSHDTGGHMVSLSVQHWSVDNR